MSSLSAGQVYNHKGKSAWYTVSLLGPYSLSQDIKFGSDDWAQVDFDVDTGPRGFVKPSFCI